MALLNCSPSGRLGSTCSWAASAPQPAQPRLASRARTSPAAAQCNALAIADVQLMTQGAQAPQPQGGTRSRRRLQCQAAAATAPAAAPAEAPSASVQEARARLQLYNTMARRKEQFQPRLQGQVQMYVCGVTVYDLSHIGHARVYVAFDLLYRLLASPALRYSVQYVRNFTDVDDKIIARAAQRGEDPLELAGRFIDEFHKDMAQLNCLLPTHEPRATAYIPQMIESIQRIMANGHAYVVAAAPGSEPGTSDVYFDVATLQGYGALSGRQQEDNRAGERVSVDERKRSPADFALWKAAKPGEPSWPSPWGPGRPGWHIECSAMIDSIMGPTIDIHGGGRDLVFPHHENELAQARAMLGGGSCCGLPHHQHQHQQHDHDSEQPAQPGEASTSGQGLQQQQQQPVAQREFVRYWLHNGFVNVDSEKMSKSLGNFFTIRDVLQSYHALALRWFLASTHYRAPVNYSSRALDEASDRLYYVYQALVDALDALPPQAPGQPSQQGATAPSALEAAVYSALLDDLNSPAALAELSAPLKAINDLLTTKAGRKRPDRLEQLSALATSIARVLSLVGLLATPASSSTSLATADGHLDAAALRDQLQATLAELRQLFLRRVELTEAYVQEQIQARADARGAKDFATADAVRVRLASQGVAIMDTPQGTTWRPVLPSA